MSLNYSVWIFGVSVVDKSLVRKFSVHDKKYNGLIFKEALELVEALPKGDYIIAGKGYDSDRLRIQVKDKGAVPVIPRKKNSTVINDDMDWCLYKYRHLVEKVFL